MFKRLSTGLLAAALVTTVGAAPAIGQPPDRPAVGVTITNVVVAPASYHVISGISDPVWGCVMTISAALSGITKGNLKAISEVNTGQEWWYEIGWPSQVRLTRDQDAITFTSGIWMPWEVADISSARATVYTSHGGTRIVQDSDTQALTGLHCAPEPEL